MIFYHCLWLHISRFYCTMLFGTMSVTIMSPDWFFTCPATSADICFHVTVTLPHSQAAINTKGSCWPWQEIIGSVGYVLTKTSIVSLCCMFTGNAVTDSQMWPKYDWFLLVWVGYFEWVQAGNCKRIQYHIKKKNSGKNFHQDTMYHKVMTWKWFPHHWPIVMGI